ncbi:hypothetical protein KY285_035801 [Solanum tuberosum]|nr:hypothetical protein KY285_035801 [Solanum tuberosum]
MKSLLSICPFLHGKARILLAMAKDPEVAFFKKLEGRQPCEEVTNIYNQEKLSVDEMLKQRDNIHSSFTVSRSIANLSGSGSGHFSNGSSSKVLGEDYKTDSPGEDGSSDSKDKSSKKRWFNLNLKGSDKKELKSGVCMHDNNNEDYQADEIVTIITNVIGMLNISTVLHVLKAQFDCNKYV